MQGLLGTSIDDPRTLGLLQMAAALSSGRKFMPALAQGLLARQQVVQGAADAEEAKKDREMRRGLLDMQIKEQQRQAEQAGIDRRLTQQAFTPIAPINANAASGVVGPRPEALQVAGQMPAFDPAQFIRQGGTPQAAFSLQQSLAKERPKIKEYREIRMPDGSVQVVGLDEYGKPVNTGQTPFKAEEIRDFGGFVGGIDPITGKARKVGDKTQSPDSKASNAVAWANVGLSRDRLNFDKENSGGFTYQTDGTGQIVALPKRPTGPGPITAYPVQGQGSQGRKDANEALAIIGEARKHLDTATGSGVGAALDATAGFFGKATEGGKATAQLQALAGALVAKMPKMSGPQSDKDVLLYKQMAADIGNPWTPNEQRKAALDVVERLQRQYAGVDPMQRPAPGAPASAPVLRFNPQTGGFD